MGRTLDPRGASTCAHDGGDAGKSACERQRVISDIHDGLGAVLIGLLHYVRSGCMDAHVLEQRVTAALLELRMAVDALDPAGGDLSAVLGRLRHRLEPLVTASGMLFHWYAAPVPPLVWLDSTATFSLQRIAFEAIANALKHSAARTVSMSVCPAGRGVEILIRDDGRGFEPGRVRSGHGLASIRARAARLGASLSVDSTPGTGTIVRLAVPRCSPPAERTTRGQADGAPPRG